MAGDYPQFVRGRVGDLHHYHLNKAFRLLEDLERGARQRITGTTPDESDRIAKEEIPAGAIGNEIDADAPLLNRVIWGERFLDEHCQFVDEQIVVNPGGGGFGGAGFGGVQGPELGTGVPPGGGTAQAYKRHGDTENGDLACLMTPPNGFIRHVRSLDGQHRFVWVPATSVYAVEITSVTGGSPPDYIVKSVDESWSSVIALTPIDRWSNIDYDPRVVGDIVLAVVVGSQTKDIKLFAFETPQFTQCPGGAAGATAPQRGGLDAASFIGL